MIFLVRFMIRRTYQETHRSNMHLFSRMDRLNLFLESFSVLSVILDISNEELAVDIDVVSDNLIKSLILVFFLNKFVKLVDNFYFLCSTSPHSFYSVALHASFR